jgi:hypothetical protein
MFSDEMLRPSCEWCRRLIKARPRGRPARFCSASCRQRAYERRLLAKEKQAEADAINAEKFPTLAAQEKFPAFLAHLQAKPKMPPRSRPRKLRCPVCMAPIAVKKRGPLPETCSRRCALTLALHRAYKRGIDVPVTLLKRDIAAISGLDRRRKQRDQERRRRYQEIINGMLAGALPRRR